jgi:hypothetical protein
MRRMVQESNRKQESRRESALMSFEQFEQLEPAATVELALGLPSGELARRRESSNSPPFYRLGHRSIYYKRSEVLAWLERTRQNTPSADDRPHTRGAA